MGSIFAKTPWKSSVCLKQRKEWQNKGKYEKQMANEWQIKTGEKQHMDLIPSLRQIFIFLHFNCITCLRWSIGDLGLTLLDWSCMSKNNTLNMKNQLENLQYWSMQKKAYQIFSTIQIYKSTTIMHIYKAFVCLFHNRIVAILKESLYIGDSHIGLSWRWILKENKAMF